MDPNLLLLVVFVVLIGWMFFSSRRNRAKQKEAAELKATQLVPGARVMTRSGLFGTLVAYDKDDLSKPTQIEIAPGVIVEVHSQAVDLAPDAAVADADTTDETDETPAAAIVDAPETSAATVVEPTPAAEADTKSSTEFGTPDYKLPEIDFGTDKDADKKD